MVFVVLTRRASVLVPLKTIMRFMNWEQDSLYNTEEYQQLRKWSLLAIGCHI